MNENFMPKSRDENIWVQELGSEILIYDALENKAFCLNETSALIWQECDGTKSVEEIAENAGKKASNKISTDFVRLALDELNEQNLLQSQDFAADILSGMTRREVIKKVGLASALALPVVTSLVSPLAAQAASTCIQNEAVCPNPATDVCCSPSLECQNFGAAGFLCATTT